MVRSRCALSSSLRGHRLSLRYGTLSPLDVLRTVPVPCRELSRAPGAILRLNIRRGRDWAPWPERSSAFCTAWAQCLYDTHPISPTAPDRSWPYLNSPRSSQSHLLGEPCLVGGGRGTKGATLRVHFLAPLSWNSVAPSSFADCGARHSGWPRALEFLGARIAYQSVLAWFDRQLYGHRRGLHRGTWCCDADHGSMAEIVAKAPPTIVTEDLSRRDPRRGPRLRPGDWYGNWWLPHAVPRHHGLVVCFPYMAIRNSRGNRRLSRPTKATKLRMIQRIQLTRANETIYRTFNADFRGSKNN